MYAVMGITGQVGAVVAETSLAHRQQVRAIVRWSWDALEQFGVDEKDHARQKNFNTEHATFLLHIAGEREEVVRMEITRFRAS